MSLVQISYHLAIDPETVCAMEQKSTVHNNYVTTAVEITTTHGVYTVPQTTLETVLKLLNQSTGDPE